jgi:hypothetical protein
MTLNQSGISVLQDNQPAHLKNTRVLRCKSQPFILLFRLYIKIGVCAFDPWFLFIALPV